MVVVVRGIFEVDIVVGLVEDSVVDVVDVDVDVGVDEEDMDVCGNLGGMMTFVVLGKEVIKLVIIGIVMRRLRDQWI